MTALGGRGYTPLMTATIRLARSEDAEMLARLKLITFRQTFLEEGFAIPYPPADLAAFEAASYAPGAVAVPLATIGPAGAVAPGWGSSVSARTVPVPVTGEVPLATPVPAPPTSTT